MVERRANRNYIRHLETIEGLLENGAGGGGTPYAVKYTAQSLSSSEQEQARENIDAAASSALSGKQDTLVSGTNIKTVGGQSLLGSGNVTVNDTSAVKFDAAQSLTTAQQEQARQNIGAISAAEMTNMEYVTAAIRPEAGANTMGKIYMIGPDSNDEYERYFTQEVGGVYSWVSLGSTEIDLSGYATGDEVAQLERKVDDISTGKYYGYYATAGDLPDDDSVPGFAYVGSGPTYTIYNFDGTSWTSTGLSVNQSPIGNDEDIDQDSNGKLQFANRIYNSLQPNGMGYKILRQGVSFASQMTDTNTIYEVRNNFDLNSGTLTVPAGSIIRFNGGKISNGTITGQKTMIDAGNVQVFDNVTFSGSFTGSLNAYWVGAKTNDNTFDNSPIIQSWLNSYYAAFLELVFPEGEYYFSSPVTMSADHRNLILNGNGSKFNVNIADSNDAGQYFISFTNNTTGSVGENFRLIDVSIINTRTTSSYHLSKTRCIFLDRSQRFNFTNVYFYYFDVGVVLKDCWYGGMYGTTFFYGCRIGVQTVIGNYYETNTLELINVDFSGPSRTTIAAVWPQNDGESDDDYVMRTARVGFDSYTLLQGVTLRGCIMESFDFGVKTNWPKRTSAASVMGGTFTVDGCYFEGCSKYAVYIGNGYSAGNGTGTSLLRMTHQVTISNCRIHSPTNIFLLGAIAQIFNNEACTIYGSVSSYVTTSVLYYGDVSFDSSCQKSIIITKVGVDYVGNIYQLDGNRSASYAAIKPLVAGRTSMQMRSFLASYDKGGSGASNNMCSVQPWNLDTLPNAKVAIDVQPNCYRRDQANSYYRLEVPSGSDMKLSKLDNSLNFRTLNNNGGIPLYEFLRRWQAGTSYSGIVANLFPYPITADPLTGTVRNANNELVGFGKNAFGTSVITGMSVGYYVFIDAMVHCRFSYSRLKYYADMLQCGRTYKELINNTDAWYNDTLYLGIYGSATNLDSIQKRINSVYYDTTNSKLKIYTGFEWVDMTSPLQRYYYQDSGAKLAERATMPDFVGQTFHNTATGITYVFTFGGGQVSYSPRWISNIGKIDSLDHPNGYTYDNTLSYANELTAGEQVIYNGSLYTWNGSSFDAENPVQALTAGGKKIWVGTQADYDLLTPANDTLYFIKSS